MWAVPAVFLLVRLVLSPFFFFFNDTATTEIYTLSLHDALPIWINRRPPGASCSTSGCGISGPPAATRIDRKSTRLNSSHSQISYAVFCLKKKNVTTPDTAYLQIAQGAVDGERELQEGL